MKICPNIPFADAKEERRQGERGFTMVEIAIAIGVIGFALVAVIGILPAGMNVQKDNREDTTIGEDAPVFLNAIRNGANVTNLNAVNGGLDFLTNYVEKILFIGVTNGNFTTNIEYAGFTSGSQIVGLLSTPEHLNVTSNNYSITRAIVRALGGAGVQQNGANLATAFRYQLDVEIVPFVNIPPDSTNFDLYTYGSPDYIIRSNRWLEVTVGLGTAPSVDFPTGTGALAYNLYDVRLHFTWPVISDVKTSTGTSIVTGPGGQNFRTMVASGLVQGNTFQISGSTVQPWYFQPQLYATNDQGNL
jgi:type II secretory pathway pseudopilin PulG